VSQKEGDTNVNRGYVTHGGESNKGLIGGRGKKRDGLVRPGENNEGPGGRGQKQKWPGGSSGRAKERELATVTTLGDGRRRKDTVQRRCRVW